MTGGLKRPGKHVNIPIRHFYENGISTIVMYDCFG